MFYSYISFTLSFYPRMQLSIDRSIYLSKALGIATARLNDNYIIAKSFSGVISFMVFTVPS